MNKTNKNPHSCERGFLFGWDSWIQNLALRKRLLKLFIQRGAKLKKPLAFCGSSSVYLRKQKQRTQKCSLFLLAGIAGFEPANARVKVLCLTAWRYPNIRDQDILSQFL